MAREKKPKLAERALLAEEWSAATPERDLCQKCGLFSTCKTPFMRPFVPKGWHEGRKILVVLEAPGQHEDEVSGRPVTGPAGELFFEMLEEAGIPRWEVARTNANVCRPQKNATPTITQIRACRPLLLGTLLRLRPSVVLALGSTAARALGNMSRQVKVGKLRGHALIIPGLDYQTLAFVTYHPSAVLRGRKDYREKIVADLARVGRSLHAGPEAGWPTEAQVALDTEFAPDGTLLTLAYADRTRAFSMESEFEGPHTGFIAGHCLPPDLDYLIRRGWARPEWVEGHGVLCTMLLARMHDENRGKGGYNLERLAFEYADIAPWKNETDEFVKSGRVGELSSEVRQDRCRRDAHAAAVLADVLYQKVRVEYGKRALPLVEFTHAVDMTLRRVYLAGAAVDMKTFNERGETLRLNVERLGDLLVKHARQHGMTEFSPTNDHHVRDLVYNKLALTSDRKTEKGLPAVDKHTLKAMKHDLVNDLLAYRKDRKLLGVWYGTPDRKSKREPLAKLLEASAESEAVGVLRFRLRTLGTRTGRRASGADVDVVDSVGHNAQNWPKSVRQIIRSRWALGRIGAFDYRKLEPRIIAWVAKDDWLMELFTTGEGYIGIGRELFGKEVQEGTQEYVTTKSTVLAAHYNATASTLAEQLWYKLGVHFSADWQQHVKECQKLLDSYLKRAKGLRRYMQAREEELHNTGRIVCPSGAVRHLCAPGAAQWDKHLVNEAINAPIQRTAAEVTGAALIDVERALLKSRGMTPYDLHRQLLAGIEPGLPPKLQSAECSLIINEVHDELTVDLFPNTLTRDVECIVETMRSAPTLRTLFDCADLPLDVDPKIAWTWHGEE